MIYVLRSAAFKEINGTETETIIKIGYTGEKSKKNRFSLYLTENPTIRTLYLIEGGTERDEKNLHRYFKNFLIYGQEWFRDVDEIIDFFETHNTKESLKELERLELSSPQITIANQNKKDNPLKIPQIILSTRIIGKDLGDDEKERLERYLWYWLDEFWGVIDREFSEYKKEIEQELKKIQKIKEDNRLVDFIIKLYYDNNFERRMKYLFNINRDFPSFFPIYKSQLLNIIPLRYQNYINLIGLDKIRSLNYKEIAIIRYIENLEKESALFEKSNTNSGLVSLFSIGQKYSKKQIKEMLRKFYEENNITKTPKATDLGEYFNFRSCQFVEKEIEKKVHGFEIISLKE